jgi:phage FluMu protein Com
MSNISRCAKCNALRTGSNGQFWEINLGETQEEEDSRTKLAVLCPKCFNKWGEVYEEAQHLCVPINKYDKNKNWFKLWRKFTNKNQAFIFR